jgi:epoxyqueuosine reductase QueG
MDYQESRIRITPCDLCFPTSVIPKVQFRYLHEQPKFDAEAAIKTDEDYRMHRPAEKISQEKLASSPVQTICHNVIY